MRKATDRLVVGTVMLFLLAALAGCGGGGSQTDTRGVGSLSVTVRFPPDGADVAAIPRAANSLRVSISDPSQTGALAPDVIVSRAGGQSQVVRIDGLSPGKVAVTAAAYVSGDGTGEVVARARAIATVVPGVSTPLRMVLGLLPHTVGVSPKALRLQKGAAQELTPTVYDADGDILVGSFSFEWASDATGVAIVDQDGAVTGVTPGTAKVTVTEVGSGKQASCDIEVWQPGPVFAVFSAPHYRGSQDDTYQRAALSAMCAEPEVSFIVGLGDITQSGTVKQMEGFKALMEETGKRWYLLRGDHENFVGAKTWETVFGEASFTFTQDGVTFMGVDTTDGTGGVTSVVVPDESLEWVRTHLPGPNEPLVVFTHFPLIDAWKPVSETVWSKRGRPRNADALMDLFAPCNLIRVACGHWRADVSDTTTRPGTTISTGWCISPSRENHDGAPQKGYYVYQYSDGAVTGQFRPFTFSN